MVKEVIKEIQIKVRQSFLSAKITNESQFKLLFMIKLLHFCEDIEIWKENNGNTFSSLSTLEISQYYNRLISNN